MGNGLIVFGQANITLPVDTFEEFQTYEIDWQPDMITWSVNGVPGRTLLKSETWNALKEQFDYPQTPALIQLSIWPGGLATNGAATIAWAGGLIDWDGEDIQEYGYYYAQISEITIDCYSPPSGANITGNTSYVYDSGSGLEDSVAITDEGTSIAP